MTKKRSRGSGEGSIFERKDGRFVAELYLGVDKNGKKNVWRTYGKTRKQVATALTKMLEDRRLGGVVANSRQTTGEYLQTWLRDVKESVRPTTYARYCGHVRRALPIIGQVPLVKLTPTHLQMCYSALLDRGLAPNTVRVLHVTIGRALRLAVRWQVLPRCPAEGAIPPRAVRREMKILNAEQMETLFTATAGDPLHALWVLLATTGLRRGEALGLRWDDVNLDEHRLTVQRTLTRVNRKFVFTEPKTTRSRRTVHLAPGTTAALREHRRRQLEVRIKAGGAWQDQGLVFCSATGGPLHGSGVGSAWHAATKAAALPSLRVHDLRHTAATYLLTRGTHPKVVQELLGHSSIKLTLDLYSHVAPVMHEALAREMERLFQHQSNDATS